MDGRSGRLSQANRTYCLETYPITQTLTMTRRSSRSKADPAESDLQVTPEDAKVEAKKPVDIEQKTLSEEPETPKEAAPAEKIQTDVRQKLAKKSADEDAFVPANPVALEKAAKDVAKDQGFELNRGTSVGARLMARAQKRV